MGVADGKTPIDGLQAASSKQIAYINKPRGGVNNMKDQQQVIRDNGAELVSKIQTALDKLNALTEEMNKRRIKLDRLDNYRRYRADRYENNQAALVRKMQKIIELRDGLADIVHNFGLSVNHRYDCEMNWIWYIEHSAVTAR